MHTRMDYTGVAVSLHSDGKSTSFHPQQTARTLCQSLGRVTLLHVMKQYTTALDSSETAEKNRHGGV